MQHYAAFHLGINCLPKYPLSSIQRVNNLHAQPQNLETDNSIKSTDELVADQTRVADQPRCFLHKKNLGHHTRFWYLSQFENSVQTNVCNYIMGLQV